MTESKGPDKHHWDRVWDTLEPGQQFDAEGPAPAFKELVESGELSKEHGGRVLVPGCGRGYDVVLLFQHGFQPVGLDLVERAVLAAQNYTQSQLGNRAMPRDMFVCGDFFASTDLEKHSFDYIYDYTFLCALPIELRTKWAARMKELLKPTGQLITLIFPIVEKVGGPPFAVSVEGIKALLEPIGFEAVWIRPVTKSHPGREGKEQLGMWRLRA